MMAGLILGGVAIVLLTAVFVFPFFLHPAGPYPFFYGYYPAGPFSFFPFGFFAVIFLIFIVSRWLFWGWGWRRGYGRGYWRRYQYYGGAAEILKERYARGELTKEQFDQMMKDIQ
jgi:putative membrane protein